MAKATKAVTKYAFPSRFGSHKSMVDESLSQSIKVTDEKFKQLTSHRMGFGSTDLIVCVDEDGPYVTTTDRLDTGISDPNRWSARSEVLQRLGVPNQKSEKESTNS